jgi:hypothetical protein
MQYINIFTLDDPNMVSMWALEHKEGRREEAKERRGKIVMPSSGRGRRIVLSAPYFQLSCDLCNLMAT